MPPATGWTLVTLSDGRTNNPEVLSNSGQNRRVAGATKNTAYYPAPFSTGAILTLFKQIAIFSSLPLWLPHRKIFEPNHRPTLLPGGAVLAAPATRQSAVTNTNMHFLSRLSLARFDEQAGGSLHIVGLDIVLSRERQMQKL